MLRFLLRAIAVAAAFAIGSAANAAPIDATFADDVCASDADPCVVADVVRVAPGSALDFGTRALSITGRGRLDFGSGSAQVLCGPFTASTDGVAILAAGPSGGVTAGGTVKIVARGACSAASPARACRTEFDCQLGTCSARRCSDRGSVLCTDDAGCSGTCTSRRCSNSSFVRCTVDADCSFGTCPEQLTCSGDSGGIQNCSVDGDCDLGLCGEASLLVEGTIEGRSSSPAAITLEATDSVTLRGSVDLSATSNDAYGGEVTITAHTGNAVLEGSLRARGGGLGGGGYLDVRAGRDANVTASMNMSGGDSDGGEIDILAGRDATVDSDINLSATGGAGWAGGLGIEADRNIVIGSGPTRRRIMANGHSDRSSFGGGGNFGLYAGGDITVAQGVEIRARGARDGVGGYFDLYADGGFEMNGRYDARAAGKEGSGGLFVVHVGKDLAIGASALIDFRSTYGGTAELYAESGNTTLDGSVRIGGPYDGENGSFFLESCRVTLGGSITNNIEGSHTRITAYESMHLLAGSAMLTPKGGNYLTYRAAEKPPILNGTVTPAPILELDEYLSGCPVCGNSEIDEGETCDDGNTATGDGCDDSCQLE